MSLAAALALPTDFPERDLLIFLTLAVIFATLVLQGLTLPRLIRLLMSRTTAQGGREELHARKAATQAALKHLRELEGADGLRPDTIERMIALYESASAA